MKLSEYFRRIFDDHYAGIRDTHAVGSFSDLDADESRSFCRGGVSFQMAGSKIDIGHNILDLFDLYIDGRLRFEDVPVGDVVPRLVSALRVPA